MKKRLISTLDFENLEKQYNHMWFEDEKSYYKLPYNRSTDKLTCMISPPATPEMWNQDPIDYHSPHPGQDGYFADSSRWIGR